MAEPYLLDRKIATLSPDVDETLRQEVQQALRTLRDAGNPRDMLLGLSSTCLHLLREVLARAGYSVRCDMLYNCIMLAASGDETIKGLRLLPDELATNLHTIRIHSNKPRHAVGRIQLTVADAETDLRLFLRVLEWFSCEYEHGPRLPTIYAQEPTMEPTLQQQLEQLSKKLLEDARRRTKPIVGLRFKEVGSEFKDRVDKIAHIHRLLNDQTIKLISIVGRGGIGKTALLSKVCAEIERGELRLSEAAEAMGVDGILYISCRDPDLTLERLFKAVEDLFERMGRREDAEELKRVWNDTISSISNKVSFMLSKLQDGCYLLVLDNLEDVLASDNTLDDRDLKRFLDLCLITPHALRLVVTSREQVVVGAAGIKAARTVLLDKGLPDDDAAILLRELDPEGDLGLRDADEGLLRKAAQLCFGFPRALEAIAGLITSDQRLTLESLLSDTQLFNEYVVENLVAEHYHRITGDERRVLEALAVYNRPVPFLALKYLVSGFFPDIEVTRNLSSLVSSYFITHIRGRDSYDLHPIDRYHAYVQIPEEGDYNKRACHRRAAYFYLSLSDELRGGKPFAERILWDLTAQLQWADALGYAVEHLFAAQAWQDIMQTPEPIKAFYLARFNWGYIQESFGLCRRLLDAARLAGEERGEAEWLHDWAVVNQRLKDYQSAKEACLQGLEITRRTGQVELEGHLLHRLAATMRIEGKYKDAKRYFEESVAVKERHGGKAVALYTRTELASLLEDEGALNKVLEIHEGCLKDAYNIGDYTGIVAVRRNIARVLRKQGAYERAERLCLEIFPDARQLGDELWVARVLQETARIAFAKRDQVRAQDFFDESRELAERTSAMRELAEIYADMGLLEHEKGNIGASRTCYEDALAVDLVHVNYSCRIKLGVLCIEEGKIEEAQNHLQKGMEICNTLLEDTPDLYDVLYHLGLAQLLIGQPTNALFTYGRALDICSARGIVDRALRDLSLVKRISPLVDGLAEVLALVDEKGRRTNG